MADERARGDNEPIRVLIADDHALFRRGLNMVLESEEGIDVVAEAEDGQDAIAKSEEFAPDVVLMDVRMPRVSGIEATRTIRDVIPTAKILMLTVSDEEEDLYEAIKAGANGYLLKEISIEEVADAIRAVVQGQSLISPSMASKLLTEFNTLVKRAEEKQQFPAPRTLRPLSQRRRRWLVLPPRARRAVEHSLPADVPRRPQSGPLGHVLRGFAADAVPSQLLLRAAPRPLPGLHLALRAQLPAD